MATKATIHINLTESEVYLKKMIGDLRTTESEGNPYYKRSENYVAKTLLARALEPEHIRYCKKGRKKA